MTALLLAAALGCISPDTQALVGLWESLATSRGGIGHVLEFRADGSFVEATSVLVNVAYRLDGDQLFVAENPAQAQAATQGSKVRIEGDVLVQAGMDGSSVRKERIGARDAAAGAPIVGAWRYRHPTGAMAFERYTGEGALLFRLPLNSSSGCYLVQGDGVTLVGRNGERRRVAYVVQEAQLEIREAGKPPARYRRESAGPWYPRETVDYQPPSK